MSRITQSDIVMELVDLAEDLLNEMRQQLGYLQASAYKGEAAAAIEAQMERLRTVLCLLNDSGLLEPVNDFRASITSLPETQRPQGECSFARRVQLVLSSLTPLLRAKADSAAWSTTSAVEPQRMTTTIQEQRADVLALCPIGSRQWSFFSSL